MAEPPPTSPTSAPPGDQISEAQVRHVAKLNRIRLDEAAIPEYARQLSDVLHHVAMLQELDVGGVEPMAHAGDVNSVLRDDAPVAGLSPDEALDQAPGRDGPYFAVPKVIDGGSGA